MADAPYTPSIDELREGYASRVLDGYERNYEEWEDLPHFRKQAAEFDRAIAAHVADEVERLAKSAEKEARRPAGSRLLDWRDRQDIIAERVGRLLLARAAELRKEQTDEQ